MAQLGPTLVVVLNFETDSDATRRRPSRSIEYVGRNRAHRPMQFTKELHLCRKSLSGAIYAQLSSFLSRSSVILACSAAPSRNSVS